MKKMLSLMLTMLLLAVPVLGSAQESAEKTTFDYLWEQYDLSFLTDLGVLTEEETGWLMADRAAVDAGYELVTAMQLATGALTGAPAKDAALAELLGTLQLTTRIQQDEASAVAALAGQEVLTIGYGEQDGQAYLNSNLLNGTVVLTEEDLGTLPNRLVNAAQALGLITQQEAYQLGYQLALLPASAGGGLAPWWAALLMEQEPLPELDLTAWNAVLADVQSRMVTGPVTEQPVGCDEAASMWTLEVTPADILEFTRAALITVRDNPALSERIADSIGYNTFRSSSTAAMGTFTEEYIDPLLQELEAAEALIPATLRMTGWEDAAGELVRLDVDMLDMSVTEAAPEAAEAIGTDSELSDYFTAFSEAQPKVVMSVAYTRQTAEDATTSSVLYDMNGTGVLVAFVHGEGQMKLTLSDVTDEGAEEFMSAGLVWDVQRAAGYTILTADAIMEYPDSFVRDQDAAGERPSARLELELVMSERSCRMILNGRSTLSDTPISVWGEADYAMEGLRVTGTERGSVSCGGETMLTFTANVHTQEPRSSVFDGEAVRLASLTDEELTAWLTGLVERGEAAAAEAMALLPQSIRDALESFGE